MDVDFENLALAEQVLARQKGHAEAIQAHLKTYATLDNQDLGLILQLFRPINDAILWAGDNVVSLSSQVFEAGARKMGETRQTYEEAERAAYEASASVAKKMGMTVPPYAPPSKPTLGAPKEDAGTFYCYDNENIFSRAFKDGASAREWVEGTADRIAGRVEDGLSGTRTVIETHDVRSYLPTPNASEPEIKNVRWEAGVILGGVDWLFEQLFGYSLLAEVTKPFAGNWTRIGEASISWKHSGDAITAVGENVAGLCPPMASWTGKGSEAFLVVAALASKAHIALQGPAEAVSTMISKLAEVSKMIAKLILKQLKIIQRELLILAAQAAVPVAGWVVAAADTVRKVQVIVDVVRAIYKLLETIYDFVAGTIQAKTQVVDAAFHMVDLYEALVRAAAARVFA
ncbi:MAG: hypothetical protein FWD18_09125 [Micrococcales bacterium]|nr:hypothetical protein [Micrococcales bacterium]